MSTDVMRMRPKTVSKTVSRRIKIPGIWMTSEIPPKTTTVAVEKMAKRGRWRSVTFRRMSAATVAIMMAIVPDSKSESE
jgi:hypothetical protein